ncbi:MAG: 23S rRNA (pseudouridine(1915)-N(3))-methyltransferase RlmH [Acidobacteriota bacterium]
MRLRFLWIGKTRDSQYSQLEYKYLGRLRQFIPSEITVLPELKKTDRRQQAAQMEREARLIEEKLTPDCFLVILSDTGKQYSSRELSSQLEGLMIQGISEVTFLIGGHLGIPERIRQMADSNWSLSKLTFPHELARIVLLEQVYRALTIIRGLPYHK